MISPHSFTLAQRIARGGLALFAIATAAVASAETGTVTYTATAPTIDTNWTANLSVPQFNRPGVHLDSVEITFSGTVNGSFFAENTGPTARDFSDQITSQLSLTKADGTPLLQVQPATTTIAQTLGAFDGEVDYAGTSGVSYPDLSADASDSVTYTSDSDVAAFQGNGSVSFGASANAQSVFEGPGNFDTYTLTQAGASVQVTYHFSFENGCIGDRVWFDKNCNGIQDCNEVGVPNVNVNLRDASGNVVKTTVTDAKGNYLFTDLVPGTYSVQFLPTGGWGFTKTKVGSNNDVDSDANPDGTTRTITVASGDCVNTVDAGLVGTGKIGDTVWKDGDCDGKFEPEVGELGIPCVNVYLLGDINGDCKPDIFASTKTDAKGNYLFSCLPPGKYKVIVDPCSLPHGYVPTYDLDGLKTPYCATGNLTFPTDATKPFANLDFDFGFKPWCTPGIGNECAWINYSCYWPTNCLTIGGKTYDKATLLKWLCASDCYDKSIAVFQEVICAKLNIGLGNSSALRICTSSGYVNLGDQIRAADAWLAKYPVGCGVRSGTSAANAINGTLNLLNNYNNGCYR